MSDQQLTIADAIEGTQERFLSIAPAQMKFESEKGFAIQILKNNDYLMGVAMNHPQSLQQALTNVAAIGLSLNPAEKQAYLIPRSVNVKGKYVTKVFLEPSYMGLIKLATDSGSIKWVQALPVYANDEFTFNGVGLRPGHTFNPFAKPEQRGPFIGVYCVAKTVDDDFLVTMMSEDQVNDIRGRSEQWKKSQSGPWKTDYIEQAKKSVIRNGFKTWPRTDLNRMAQAVELSNSNEGFEPILTSPSLGEYTAETKEYFDQMITNRDALGMYVFQRTLNESNESTFNNLYHSFEKGQKGKFQSIIKELIDKGFSIIVDIRESLSDAIERDDELGISEIIDDLDKDALSIVKDGMSIEHLSALERLSPQ